MTLYAVDAAAAGVERTPLATLDLTRSEANVTFSETAGVGQVRIARFDHPEEVAGYWSWVGTEILETPEDRFTIGAWIDAHEENDPDGLDRLAGHPLVSESWRSHARRAAARAR